MIEARPPHTSAYVLHRSGDWLFYDEGGTTESGPAAFDPPAEYYALDLRSGQRRHLLTLRGRSRIGYSSGPNLSGSAFGDDGFAYIAATTSSGECRDQLRLHDLGSGEDRLLFEVESADTVLDSPLLGRFASQASSNGRARRAAQRDNRRLTLPAPRAHPHIPP